MIDSNDSKTAAQSVSAWTASSRGCQSAKAMPRCMSASPRQRTN